MDCEMGGKGKEGWWVKMGQEGGMCEAYTVHYTVMGIRIFLDSVWTDKKGCNRNRYGTSTTDLNRNKAQDDQCLSITVQ